MTGWSLQQAGQAVHEGTQVLGSGKWDQLGQDLLLQPGLWGPVGAEKPGLQRRPQGLPQDRNDSGRSWGGDEREGVRRHGLAAWARSHWWLKVGPWQVLMPWKLTKLRISLP